MKMLLLLRDLLVAAALILPLTTGWIAPIVRRNPFVVNVKMSETEEHKSSSLQVLGICGGIGSGKSHACKLLVQHSDQVVAHLEADSIAHAVYTPGNPALEEIATTFGAHLLHADGTLNRQELGAIVFSDPSQMATLERIVWPYVKKEIQARLQELRQEYDHGIVVLEAAVLLDAEWDDMLNAVWVVTTPAPIAIERLVSNRNFTREEAQKRIEAQEPRRGIGNLQEEVQHGVVTKVIFNTNTEQDLQDALLQALQDPSAWKQ